MEMNEYIFDILYASIHIIFALHIHALMSAMIFRSLDFGLTTGMCYL